MKLESKYQSLLKALLIASIIATGIHFTDNYRFIEQYPQPVWITAPSICQSWLLLTAVGITGYWLHKFDKFWLAYGCLILYSVTGLARLGHYFFGSLSEFSLTDAPVDLGRRADWTGGVGVYFLVSTDSQGVAAETSLF